MRVLTALVLSLATVALGMSTTAHAQSATFYTVTYVEVVTPAESQAATIIKQYGEATRKDAGAVRVETLQRIDRPNQFVVSIAWTDQKAFEAHLAAASAKELQKLLPLLAAPNDTRQHQALSVDTATGKGSNLALYVATHVDVIPPRKDDAVVALKQLADESRKDRGHVRFDVVQQTNRPNHFTVVEVWTDRAAFDAHAMAPHTRKFRTDLGPMSGSLYDERLYQSLE